MPDRIRVTHPRTEAARRATTRTPTREIDEQTALGDLYVTSLIRSQRLLAGVVIVIGIGGLMVTACLGAMVPAWSAARLFGLSIPWLVLGVGVYPAMILLAALAVRRAERNERTFTELVRHR